MGGGLEKTLQKKREGRGAEEEREREEGTPTSTPTPHPHMSRKRALESGNGDDDDEDADGLPQTARQRTTMEDHVVSEPGPGPGSDPGPASEGLCTFVCEQGTCTWGLMLICEGALEAVFVPHREKDLPAVIKPDGTLEWYSKGVPWRQDPMLPHRVSSCGTQTWLNKDLKPHRVGLPAILEADGTERWMRDGVYYREDDGPHIVTKQGVAMWMSGVGPGDPVLVRKKSDLDGVETWFVDGVAVREVVRTGDGEIRRQIINADGSKTLHSVDGLPALVDKDGTEFWYEHGKMKRPDGLPTKRFATGAEMWTDENGVPFREGDLPALVSSAGETETWFRPGTEVAFRERVVDPDDGTIRYYEITPEGTKQLHHDVHPCGKRQWYEHGQLTLAREKIEKDPEDPTLVRLLYSLHNLDGSVKKTRHVWKRDEVNGRSVRKVTHDIDKGVTSHYIYVQVDGGQWRYVLHRDGDLPAIEVDGGRKEWWLQGKRCRLNGNPHIIEGDGTQVWVSGGDGTHPHREKDLPAIKEPSGKCWWFRNGMLWRERDQPTCVLPDGTQQYRTGTRANNVLHRLRDKPAVVFADGRKMWFVDGKPWRPYHQRVVEEEQEEEDERKRKSSGFWRPRIKWTPPPPGCLTCRRVFSQGRLPLVAICTADKTHALCTACLQDFMDQVNVDEATAEKKGCPMCRCALRNCLEVPPALV